MYRGPPPTKDRRASWRSVTAGFALNAAVFAILVAVSYPVATGAVIATGLALYALGQFLRRATYERTVQVCRPGICFRVELSVG